MSSPSTDGGVREDDDAVFDSDEPEISVDPLLVLFQSRHTLTSRYSTSAQREAAMEVLIRETRTNNMAPYIRLLQEVMDCKTVSEKELIAMETMNAKKVEQLKKKKEDAETNLGDTEVREALFALCQHYYSIGDVDMCMATLDECQKKTIGAGLKLDLCFTQIRLGIAFENNEISAKGIQDAHRLLDESNWERRNRLKVYEGIYYMIVRDFKRASELLLDSVSTFASGELITFKEFVFATIVASLPALKREHLKKKIIDSPEVISADAADAYQLAHAVYNCKYKRIFPALYAVCEHIRQSCFLSAHVNYFFREARALVFTQFLVSYSRVTLTSMSNAFNLPEAALDELLSTMISNERLPCRMDRVNGSITTYRGDTTNFDYHRLIKNGDLLLNRLQKLTRLIEI